MDYWKRDEQNDVTLLLFKPGEQASEGCHRAFAILREVELTETEKVLSILGKKNKRPHHGGDLYQSPNLGDAPLETVRRIIAATLIVCRVEWLTLVSGIVEVTKHGWSPSFRYGAVLGLLDGFSYPHLFLGDEDDKEKILPFYEDMGPCCIYTAILLCILKLTWWCPDGNERDGHQLSKQQSGEISNVISNCLDEPRLGVVGTHPRMHAVSRFLTEVAVRYDEEDNEGGSFRSEWIEAIANGFLYQKYGVKKALYFGGVELHNFEFAYMTEDTVPIRALEKHLSSLFKKKRRLSEGVVILLERHLKRARFYCKLEKFGYVLFLKPVKRYEQEDDTVRRKANCDVEMTFRLMLEENNFDRAIILSGDGDFLPVLRYLRKQGKEVVIFPVGREPQGRYDNLQGVISGILNIWRQK